jgi:glyoxylase-like metal-dependent hydrolase (beta-lactamase superfamily II)
VGYFRYHAFANSSSSSGPRLKASAVQLERGIYLLGGLAPSAAYVVETPEGLILVDSGLDADAGSVKAQMASLRLDWKRIRVILLTHAHGDHVGGAEALRGATGAKIHAGAGDALVLRAGKPREAFFSSFYMPDHDPHPTTVDVALEGGESITLGDARIEALAMPGHTPGSMCYLLERDGRRMLFSGDVIMMIRGDQEPHTELDKPLGTYSAYLPPCFRGDGEAYLKTLRRLRAMPVPDLLLPGHPRADRAAESARISEEHWHELLDKGIHDMETLLARYQADGADFLDGTPKELLPDLFYLGDFHSRAVYGFVTGGRFCVVDAPGGPGLVDFLRQGLACMGRSWMPPSAVFLTARGPMETAGLTALVDQCHTQVIAAYEGIEALREMCPKGTVFIAAEDLSTTGWFPGTFVSLGGRGLSPMGYRLEWAGKTVLFSGHIPVKLDHEQTEELAADLGQSVTDLRAYFATLTRLQGVRPRLWLPAVPTHGQNANLYDADWDRVIEENLLLVKSIATKERTK